MVSKSFLKHFQALFVSFLVMLHCNSLLAQEVEAGSGQIVVPLTGTATEISDSLLSVLPTTIDLGSVDVGASAQATFTVSHTGANGSPAVLLGQAQLFGQNAQEFSADFSGNVSLSQGQSISITVTFTPLLPGDKLAGLRLEGLNDNPSHVALFKGTAMYPLSSELESSDQSISFGQVLQNTANVSNFILTNNGTDGAPDINVSAITFSGVNAGEFIPEFQPTTLAAGEQLDVRISLDSSITGAKSATAEVFHDGINGALSIDLDAQVTASGEIPVNFEVSTLSADHSVDRGTSIQFGPDGKLYVAEMDGFIHVFAVTRNASNDYSASRLETIDLIKKVINHNDDGTRDYADKRLLTGIHVTGSAAAPVIYAASSDPRQAAGPSADPQGNDSNLDTNSGILHKLSKNGNTWTKIDLVRGLPRSEENHVANGLVLVGDTIYLNIGGNTNKGRPSTNFAALPEYALSAATLEIDLTQIGDSTYDIPTLNGPADEFDPFGGHDGLNQAMLVENGPIEIFASGLRNAYDIVYTQSGRFYTWDNGPNTGWGGPPGAGSDCNNILDNGGVKLEDGLHLISKGYYAGHPNPTRGSKLNTFGGQSPIEGEANPEECVFHEPGSASGALTTNNPSTNGLDEYTASNFNGAMQGNLLAIALDKNLYRVQLNAAGDTVTSKSTLKNIPGTATLDVTSQGDNDVFPGTIWVIDNIANDIQVLEPADY